MHSRQDIEARQNLQLFAAGANHDPASICLIDLDQSGAQI
jgi:hypothetical protein